MIYPSSFEEKIDFIAIRALLHNNCLSALGRDEIDNMQLLTDDEMIRSSLFEIADMMTILNEEADRWPVSYYFDVREWLHRLRIEGTFASESELFDLQRALMTIQQMVQFFRNRKEKQYDYLHRRVESLIQHHDILNELNRLLTPHGLLKDNASAELARIRHELFQLQNSISRKLTSILRQAQEEGYVERDVTPTMRDGRLVIPVTPAYKRKINGIVHDESASGKTIFIEPAEVVEANNRIRMLEMDEKREKIRILTEFAHFIRPHILDLLTTFEIMGVLDAIRAKALLAIAQKAVVPRVESTCVMDWQQAVHPLLADSLEKQHRHIVPLDIQLDERQRLILISGPNAGGKSVCLKTVGLLQYMLQCGLPVPVKAYSVFGIFHDFLLNIGDEQSIEDDLSTYSSHLKHLNFFLRKGDERSLVLIDELGSGTEPEMGGAIAEAVLHQLLQKRVYGVITTHYTNLKLFADTHEGIVNGAMLFDRQRLQPLYQLQIGFPGNSFALEIAYKIGLPQDVIQEAKEKAGSAHVDLENYVQSILRDKRYWENKRQKIKEQEKRLEALLAQHAQDQDELKKQRKEMIDKSKQEAAQLLKEANALIENTIRKIKESSADPHITREARKEVTALRHALSHEDQADSSNVSKASAKRQKKAIEPKPVPLQVGDHVRLSGSNSIGEVIELQGVNVVVAFGNLKSTVHQNRLEKVSRNQWHVWNKQSSSSQITADETIRQRKLTFRSDIDVRGMRGEEALQAVQYFVDDALMLGVERIRILHGTGNGILRQLIRQYLSVVPAVKHFADEHIQLGGAGITVVDL
ncbi:MAG: endonuclease MutS2 [Microbacter sp.]